MPLDTDQADRHVETILLAAGQGVRMGGDRAKVLYPVADRPMIDWVLDACEEVGSRRNVVVVGHQASAVRDAVGGRPGVGFVEQRQRLGTGHAVRQAEGHFAGRQDVDVLVLCGDGPLVRAETLQTLLETHREQGASATLATATLDDPTGYGRIVRDGDGQFQGIVEHKDATEAQRRIREVNPSYYCFRAGDLFEALAQVGNDNAKGEFYVTDVFAILLSAGKKVAVVDAVPREDVLSINTPDELAEVDRVLRQRLTSGVKA